MGRGAKELRRREAEAGRARAKARSGMARLVAAVAGFAAIALVRQALLFQGVEAASSPVASIMVFATALVLAGVAGYGARDYARARQTLRDLRGK